jgi:hypothetical protein
MIGRTMVGICLVSVIWTAGCGSDDKTAATPTCPAGPGTTVLTIADVSPATGATVQNRAIEEKFTIKNAPGMFNSFTVALLASHTAGTPLPVNGTITATRVGNDLTYSSTVDSWATAPSHVETTFSGLYKTDDQCLYAFPSPLFSYDVVPATGGTPNDAGTD